MPAAAHPARTLSAHSTPWHGDTERGVPEDSGTRSGQRRPAPSATARELAARWVTLEADYLHGRYTGVDAPNSHRAIPGGPLLITAGHAVGHQRAGVPKSADMATGGLVELLAAELGAAALTVTGQPTLDPNFAPTGPFKSEVLRLLDHRAALVDVHGMRDSWGLDVCLGRGMYPAQSDQLIAYLAPALRAAGFTVGIDVPFTAEAAETLTSFVQAQGVHAVQLELSRSLRNPWDHPERAGLLVATLAAALGSVNNRYFGPVRDASAGQAISVAGSVSDTS
jgi:hypothetical protein